MNAALSVLTYFTFGFCTARLSKPAKSCEVNVELSRIGYVHGFADAVKGRKFDDRVSGWGNAQWWEIVEVAKGNNKVESQIKDASWRAVTSAKYLIPGDE